MKYRVGMYGGSFNPLHLGHVDCILRAAAQCDTLYIVLDIGVNRGEIDARVRYRQLYTVTKHLGNVKILTFEDDDASKSDYTFEHAKRDSELVKAMIGQPIDAVFCGSDYDENSFWNLCYPDSAFIVFKRNGISSTRIRENPYRHWDDLPQAVRPYYVKKVLLIGGESTGKSTLTVSLALRFGTNCVEEVGRDISMRSGDDRLMLPGDFTEILLRHKLRVMEAAEQSNKVLFVDTDALITQFFLEFIEGAYTQQNRALSDAIDALSRYDRILFLEPDVAFVQDGTRSDVIAADRVRFSERIKDIFRSHGRDFICIGGSYEQRYDTAVRIVEEMLERG